LFAFQIHFSAFNAIVRLCFNQLPIIFGNALRKYDDDDGLVNGQEKNVDIKPKTKQKLSNRKVKSTNAPGMMFNHWARYKPILNQYLTLLARVRFKFAF
jgi:hypothetical protein